MNKIQDDNLFYELLCKTVKFAYQFFFRQIEVRGTENIPSNAPVIFAPNHQNALMDALAVLFYQKDPIVFLARADIFKNKKIARLLTLLKIAPIYRIRDGFENLTKNKKQMEAAEKVLLDNCKLCLMPEGNQGKQHKLRPLVKGLVRIAYSTEDILNGKSHVRIIPVGIDYNFYQHAGADLVLTYGKPIEVKDYIDYYKEKPSNAQNILRDVLAKRISPLMHDIRSTDHYDIIYNLCCYGTPAYLEVQAEKGIEAKAATAAGLRFDARCALGKIFDKTDIENPEIILELDALCSKLKKLPGYPTEVTEWIELRQTIAGYIKSIFIFLLFLPVFFLNFPAWLINYVITKNVEDKQMHSTFAFTMGIIINTIVYIVFTIIICTFLGASIIQKILCFILISFLGIICERVRQSLKITIRSILYSFGYRKKLIKESRSDYKLFKETIKKKLRTSPF